jgi:hypothetical protein
MQNCAMDKGAVGVRLREDAGDDLAVCELLVEEISPQAAKGLFEAGRRGRDIIVRLDGIET